MNRIFILSLLIILIFASCKTSKVAESTEEPKSAVPVDSIINQLDINKFDVDWFGAKFKGVYHRPEDKQGFNGQIRIRKDSVIWVSITAMMNIEVFRIEIKPDSFIFINRLEKTYISSSIEFLRDRIGVDVDFEMLQAIILGNDFPYYENDVFKLNEKPNNYLLSTISRRKLRKQSKEPDPTSKILVQNIWVNKFNFRISKQLVKIVGNDKTTLRAFYEDFKEIDGQQFANKLTVKFKEDKRTFIEFDYTKITVNEVQDFPFKVSSKYTEVEIEER